MTEEMTVREKISAHVYESKLTLEYTPRKPHDDMTIREARELEASEKKNGRAHRQAYREDQERLVELFHADLAAENGLTGHPKEKKLFFYARSNSYGLDKIADTYEELAELVK